MKFSEQWLRSLVNPKVSCQELIDRLSMAGLEVDGTEPVSGFFSGVVIGEVLSIEEHPDAKKLKICQVSTGSAIFQVVCGAINVRAGLKTAFAMVDACLPGELTIKSAKLRGIESFGMLCSASELGLSAETDGLLELPENVKAGEDLFNYFSLNDVSIDVDLTPNRGDCLSLMGLAREIGALYNEPVSFPEISPAFVSHQQEQVVSVEAKESCPRYVGRLLINIDSSQPTPLWLSERLRRSGLKSINSVVDVLNYVMIELGQPLHAFDQQKMQGDLVVRMAQPTESLTLLTGQHIKLTDMTLVIADQKQVLAIAGVMGGADSSVTNKTENIFIESAFFNPVSLAGTARSYGLHTDSAHRFERGVDWKLQRKALDRATQLLQDIVGGEAGPILECKAENLLPEEHGVLLHSTQIERILGFKLEDTVVVQLLSTLGLNVAFDVTSTKAANVWRIEIPSHRFDIQLEIDLIEEIARLYGYNNIPTKYPTAHLIPQENSEKLLNTMDFRQLLVAHGYTEAVTYSFIDPKLFQLFSVKEPIKLLNPISQDMSVMRSSLWPGLLVAAEYNLNRQQERIRFFEIGQCFSGTLENLQQINKLSAVVYGKLVPEQWSLDSKLVDFYDVKADVEAILSKIDEIQKFEFFENENVALHPGQSASIKYCGNVIGSIGALHPKLQKSFSLQQPAYLFELDLAVLLQKKMPIFQEISKFPEVRRDLAFLIDAQINVASILDKVRDSAGEWLQDARLFDVYQGKGILNNQKSLAIGLIWKHPKRTLNEDEITTLMQTIIAMMKEKFNAELRE